MPTTTTKILIYSQDGLGLGHLRRNLNVCLQIKKRSAEAACLIIADSPVAPFFRLPPNCDFVKIPTIVKIDTGIWRPDRLPMSDRELLEIRKEIILNVALSFQPDVFVVDHMPHGALGELAEPLEILRKRFPRTRIILGVRDILGDPEVIQRQWQNEGAYAAVEAFYDSVCVYGCEDVFDAQKEYRFPQTIVAKTRYCGYVCRGGNGVASGENPHFVSKPGEKLILVTGGGGADSSFFMDQFIDAARLLQPHVPFSALITVGPFMHKDQRELLRSKAKGLPITLSRTGEDSIRYLRGADLVISMAGYNTISEILHFRKNAIVVPRPGPSAEQTMRSRLMSDRGLFRTIHPHHLTAGSLADLIAEKLSGDQAMSEAAIPDLNGAFRAAACILDPVQG